MSRHINTDPKTRPSPRKKFLRVSTISGLVLLALIVISALLIAIDGLTDELHPADVAVVMGTTANPDGTPSRWLQTRLDKAIEVYNEGLVPRIIVSGGREKDGVFEGTVMGTYLESKGIPPANIIVDNEGVDTYSTAKNVVGIMKLHHWTSVMVISQFYHIPRVKMALHRFGIQEVYGAHAEWITGMAVVWLGREILAFPAYILRNY
jgi:vancomycin permeability regulator SanA